MSGQSRTMHSAVKQLTLFFITLPLLLPRLIRTASAAASSDKFGLNNAAVGTGLEKRDLPAFIGDLVLGLLGIVGVLFLILIIWGGMMWMTAAGNEQRLEKAKNIIVRATIGLVIIVAAYSITFFIIESLTNQEFQNLPGGGKI